MDTAAATVTAWKILGRSPWGRIVATEVVDDLRLAHRIANTWRGTGLAVEVKQAENSQETPEGAGSA